MPKRAVDLTVDDACNCVIAIRKSSKPEQAVSILYDFCERYRKNYTTRKTRVIRTSDNERYNAYSKKWRDANKEEYNRMRSIKGKEERKRKKEEKKVDK